MQKWKQKEYLKTFFYKFLGQKMAIAHLRKENFPNIPFDSIFAYFPWISNQLGEF